VFSSSRTFPGQFVRGQGPEAPRVETDRAALFLLGGEFLMKCAPGRDILGRLTPAAGRRVGKPDSGRRDPGGRRRATPGPSNLCCWRRPADVDLPCLVAADPLELLLLDHRQHFPCSAGQIADLSKEERPLSAMSRTAALAAPPR